MFQLMELHRDWLLNNKYGFLVFRFTKVNTYYTHNHITDKRNFNRV